MSPRLPTKLLCLLDDSVRTILTEGYQETVKSSELTSAGRSNNVALVTALASENNNSALIRCISSMSWNQMSDVMRKPAFHTCENKGTDQLRTIRAADQRLCIHFRDRTTPLLPKSENLSLLPSSVAIQPGLCWTWSETLKTGFFMTQLKHMWL